MIKRWLPFGFIIGLILFLSVNLFLQGNSQYRPTTADPAAIYQEACLGCHGNGQRPANLWSPELHNKKLFIADIKHIIRNGTWRMPAFPLIPDSTIDSLARFVADRQFVIPNSKESR
jgi:mono/diheme cytochrome c family protein